METKQNLDIKQAKINITRFLMSYKFALDEMNAKIDILRQEFEYIHDYNPIEHVKSRLKTPKSILKKINRKQLELTLPSIKENIQDIAGIRITCSFISDIYKISDMLQKQRNIKVVECKDYIKNPKKNGYKSLHLILQVPVFMSDREENVYVELQIRTIAMDFWASLEHKIYYKYDKEVPTELLDELKEAADAVSMLDEKMESIHERVSKLKVEDDFENELSSLLTNNEKLMIPHSFIKQYLKLDW